MDFETQQAMTSFLSGSPDGMLTVLPIGSPDAFSVAASRDGVLQAADFTTPSIVMPSFVLDDDAGVPSVKAPEQQYHTGPRPRGGNPSYS